jgi:hypothetical protein
MPFPQEVKAQALVASARHCCICRKFCGPKIECHHIKPEAKGGTDDIDNCIPLCFNCHADVGNYNPDHPKGNRYGESELKRHRDSWYELVRSNRIIVANPDHLKMDQDLFLDVGSVFAGSIVESLDSIYYSKNISKGDMRTIDSFLGRIKNNPQVEFMDIAVQESWIDLLDSFAAAVYFVRAHVFIEGESLEFEPDKRSGNPPVFYEYLEELGRLLDDLRDKRNAFIQIGRRQLAINLAIGQVE